MSNIPITVNVKSRSTRYLDDFVRLKCAPDMLVLNLFPNAKEITESFGAYRAVADRLRSQVSLSNASVNVFCVGDGHQPRTAATFAFRSAWTAWSIDPALKDRGPVPVARLKIIGKRIEDCDDMHVDIAIIVCVHSHSRLEECVKKIHARERHVIAMPCCVPQVLNREPDEKYHDSGILSPHDLIKIWRYV